MVGVQDKDAIHGTFNNRVHLVLFTRYREHHRQEVTGIAQIVAWVHERLTYGVLVAHGGNGRHLGNQAEGCNFTMTGIVDIQRVLIERRQAPVTPQSMAIG